MIKIDSDRKHEVVNITLENGDFFQITKSIEGDALNINKRGKNLSDRLVIKPVAGNVIQIL